jgi:oxygen-independent coproporphyrinogen-3 oxidase
MKSTASATAPMPSQNWSPPVLKGEVMGASADTLALYVHWPFCLSKCPYCDFNSHVRDNIDDARWRAALVREIGHVAAVCGPRTVTSVFFGGGTPSLMPAETVAAVLDAAATGWTLADDVEITLEANPTSVEIGRFRDFRSAGVNRVSVGVQALDEAALKFLGREHDADQALAAIEAARATFDRFSFDLIYDRPGQTVAAWREELTRALALAGDHLSPYQLTIEKGTPFHAARRDHAFEMPDEETSVALFETTQELCDAAGLPAYEISNHARPGDECRHNLTYWTGGDYAGIGPGAHGRLTLDGAAMATEQAPSPEDWLARVEADGNGTRLSEPLDVHTRIEEMVMCGLRLAAGIGRETFLARAGIEIEDALEPRRLRRLIDGGMLEIDEAGLRTTQDGRLRLNAVLGALLG